ncbi:MAG TPA: alginate export family protein, partial [Bryobacteraceae bacterium]|nr:alginate export family protein [Bryobacteraceae bacterium]
DAEFAVPFLLGLPSNATDPAPQGALGLGSNYYSANSNRQNVAMIFPKQLYVRLDGLGGLEGQTLQIGRFTFLDGSEMTPKNATLATIKRDRISQRLLGDFGWSDVGRSFDGVHYSLSGAADNFTFVGAVPTRGVFQVDGWGWNQVGFGYAAYTHEWGSGRHAADTRVFFLEYDDWRPDLKTDNRPIPLRRGDTENIRIDTFGGHSIHAITTSAGTVDLVAWGAVQTGRWGTQRQRAYAFDFEGGLQPKILPRIKPWLRAGFTEGSGDGNPSDNTHGTFFQVLPTPRPYARFPFFNMMNTEDLLGDLILRPHAKVTVSSEFHALRLTNANDLWYAGGGVFQPWTFGYVGRSTSGRRSLGNLYDTSVEYRPSRKVTLTAYLGYTQGLGTMEQIYPEDKDSRFGYLELFYRF